MRTAYIKYLIALLVSGTNGIIASQIALSSYEIVFLRTFIGSVLLTFLFKVTGSKFSIKEFKKDVLYVAISGVAMGASWMLLYEGYQQIGVSIATLLYYCGPVIVMILSPIIFKEKLTTVKIVSFIVVLVGLILINANVVNENGNIWGVICGCMSAVMYFFMITFNKKAKNITGMENATIQLVVSFLTVAFFVLIKQGLVINLDGVNWFAVIILGVVNTGMCVYFYFSSLSKIPVQSVAVLGYLEPLSAVVLSALILSEHMNGIQIVGAICILGGTMFGELVKPKIKR